MSDTKTLSDKERDGLASYHHTISEQLNARLAESPRFFWALVVVSTGYGYVLWNVPTDERQAEPRWCAMLLIAAVLSCAAVLWASWYLAALGYGFRFLQNVQHCIENALGWNEYGPRGKPIEKKCCGRKPGEPPEEIRRCGDVFWLLPSIYHAHAGGLIAFLAIIIFAGAYYWNCRQCWGSSSDLYIGIIAFTLWAIGVVIIIGINVHYVRKYRENRKDPASATVLLDDSQTGK